MFFVFRKKEAVKRLKRVKIFEQFSTTLRRPQTHLSKMALKARLKFDYFAAETRLPRCDSNISCFRFQYSRYSSGLYFTIYNDIRIIAPKPDINQISAPHCLTSNMFGAWRVANTKHFLYDFWCCENQINLFVNALVYMNGESPNIGAVLTTQKSPSIFASSRRRSPFFKAPL